MVCDMKANEAYQVIKEMFVKISEHPKEKTL